MKKIILISGKAQNGKDSTALFLKQKLPGKTLILHYADYLKYICQQYLGWDGVKDETGRQMLIDVGTYKIRKKLKLPNFHAEKVMEIIDIFQDDFDYFIVPDVRFPNEVLLPQWKYEDKVITCRINRLDFESPLTLDQQQDISETALDNFKFDYYIESLSGLDNLEVAVNELTNTIKNDDGFKCPHFEKHKDFCPRDFEKCWAMYENEK